jgi:hypothetical protein
MRRGDLTQVRKPEVRKLTGTDDFSPGRRFYPLQDQMFPAGPATSLNGVREQKLTASLCEQNIT